MVIATGGIVMFWTVSIICLVNTCSVPQPPYSPAFSLYATKALCESSIAIADKPLGIQFSCQQSDVVTFSPGSGFSVGQSLMVHRR